MSASRVIPTCPVCGTSNVDSCLRIASIPVACNVLHDTREAARAAKSGSLALHYCAGCGHLFNADFDAALVEYTTSYENSLHYSPVFRSYARSLAESLCGRYGLRRKTVVEIGCGKGDFLSLLCEAGENLGVGFDPSYEPGREDVESTRMTVRAEYFSAERLDARPDFLCCRHALEHVAAPATLLESVRVAARGADLPVYFEVPDGTYMLRRHAIWDLIYEHCGYFTAASLGRLFRGAGYEVDEIARSFGGQFLQIHASVGGSGRDVEASDEDLEALVRDFEGAYLDHVSRWTDRMDSHRRAGRTVVLWGAGSKGATFLNVVGAEDAVECIVDVNPHKHGRFVPGTGHEVVPPGALRKIRPSVIVVMNPMYRGEIARVVRQLGIDASITVADVPRALAEAAVTL